MFLGPCSRCINARVRARTRKLIDGDSFRVSEERRDDLRARAYTCTYVRVRDETADRIDTATANGAGADVNNLRFSVKPSEADARHSITLARVRATGPFTATTVTTGDHPGQVREAACRRRRYRSSRFSAIQYARGRNDFFRMHPRIT